MTRGTLAAPTSFVRNVGAHRWRRGERPDTSKPPDRFVSFPGHNNWRGGALFSFQQMKQLRDEYGIRTIVNLAADANDHVYDPERDCGGRRNQCEPLWAAELGIRYIYAPMGGSWRMSAEQWRTIQDALTQGSVFVHCSHGVDRTGAVVARWRREIDPALSHEEVMRYTRSLGGAWRLEGDPNSKLREWIARAQYDPELAARALAPRSSGLSIIPAQIPIQGWAMVSLGVFGLALSLRTRRT